MTQLSRQPLQPGDAAPDFALSSVEGDRTVSLSDYRGRSPLLLSLFRGLYCPFCRRMIAQMAATSEKLKPLGIESLAVVATELENARLYYRFRPMRLSLAVDPELMTHQSYGVGSMEPTPELEQAFASLRLNPNGELPEPLPMMEVPPILNKLDGFEPNEMDRRDMERQSFTQLSGHFLIDRDGVIRWHNIECAQEGPAGVGKYPSADELLSVAQLVKTPAVR